MSISPDSPRPGQNFSLTSSYTLDEALTGGKVSATVSLNGIPIVQNTDDLCKSLAQSPTPCPLAAGPQKSTTTSQLPADAPSGNYVGTVKWTDQNGQPVLCVQFDINVQ